MNKSQINNLIVVCAMRRCVAQNAANVTSIEENEPKKKRETLIERERKRRREKKRKNYKNRALHLSQSNR